MSRANLPRVRLTLAYEAAAEEYLRSLPPEHFMEATDHAMQRKITLESLDLVHGRRPEIQVFNELLVQYPLRGSKKFGQVVPDNMVILSETPSKARGSYNVPLEPVRPFWMLEYVSKHNKRKDYEDNFQKYERDLKVPYYLVFYPDAQEMTLYRHNGRKYVSVKPNEEGRLAIPALELEVALREQWVRFWYQGQLLPLPADLQRDLDEARRQAEEARRQAEEARRQAAEARQQTAEARQQTAEARQQAGQQQQRADQAEQRATAAEQEVERLRSQLAEAQRRRKNGK